MKIKALCGKELQKQFLDDMKTGHIELGNQGELILLEPHGDRKILYVKEQMDMIPVKIKDIIYLESFGSDVELHTLTHTYRFKEQLYVLEAQLYEHGFLRIHKSYIINRHAIKRIRPTIHMKFTLLLEGDFILEVSRSYYYQFKEEIGF